jgi:hypothetical protein
MEDGEVLMGKNKHNRVIIEGLQKQVEIHLEKIRKELEEDNSDYGMIHHWESEIKSWQDRIANLLKRIGK